MEDGGREDGMMEDGGPGGGRPGGEAIEANRPAMATTRTRSGGEWQHRAGASVTVL